MNSIQEREDQYETDENFTKTGEGSPVMVSKISNHYEVPNMSSMLYEFTNKEQDRIY